MAAASTLRRNRLLAISFVLLALVGVLIWRAFSQPNIGNDARDLLTAALEGDAETVFRLSHEYEKKQVGISERQFRQMWDMLIAPRMKGFKKKGEIQVSVHHPGHQAVAWQVIADSAGNEYEVLVAPFAVGEGEGRDHLFNFLMIAWTLEFAVSKGKAANSINSTRAELEGMMKDRATLLSIGIKGIPSRNPEGEMKSWEELAERYRKILRELEAAERDEITKKSRK